MAWVEEKETLKLAEEIKEEVTSSKERSRLAVNKEMIVSNWQIGRRISFLQESGSWRLNRLTTISEMLQEYFGNDKGMSIRNLKYMKRFAKEFPDVKVVHDLVSKIPWGHVLVIMEQISDYNERIECIKKDIENNWSRKELVFNIQTMKKQEKQKTIEY